jgi:hypothetical protein
MALSLRRHPDLWVASFLHFIYDKFFKAGERLHGGLDILVEAHEKAVTSAGPFGANLMSAQHLDVIFPNLALVCGLADWPA